MRACPCIYGACTYPSPNCFGPLVQNQVPLPKAAAVVDSSLSVTTSLLSSLTNWGSWGGGSTGSSESAAAHMVRSGSAAAGTSSKGGATGSNSGAANISRSGSASASAVDGREAVNTPGGALHIGAAASDADGIAVRKEGGHRD